MILLYVNKFKPPFFIFRLTISFSLVIMYKRDTLDIAVTERYRSGHNEAVLKTVWEQPHKGSNPFLSANKNRTFVYQTNVWFLSTKCFACAER